MTTVKVEGRRHSRRKVETATTREDVRELLARSRLSFPHKLAEIKGVCAALLKRSGLPATAEVEHDGHLSSIAVYVAKRGFGRDSPEDIAARIIEQAARLAANPQMAAQIGFVLGELWTLLRVYVAEIAPGREGGLEGKKPKQARAKDWKAEYKPEVLRRIAAGKSNEWIGMKLQTQDGPKARTIARFAAELRRKK